MINKQFVEYLLHFTRKGYFHALTNLMIKAILRNIIYKVSSRKETQCKYKVQFVMDSGTIPFTSSVYAKPNVSQNILPSAGDKVSGLEIL